MAFYYIILVHSPSLACVCTLIESLFFFFFFFTLTVIRKPFSPPLFRRHEVVAPRTLQCARVYNINTVAAFRNTLWLYARPVRNVINRQNRHLAERGNDDTGNGGGRAVGKRAREMDILYTGNGVTHH